MSSAFENNVKKTLLFIVLFIAFSLSFFAVMKKSDFSITGYAVSKVEVQNVPPQKVILFRPENDTFFYNASPEFFEWLEAIDLNDDPIVYDFLVAVDGNFTAIVWNETEINGTENISGLRRSYANISYAITDYYWKVRGFDNTSYGSWSDTWKFRNCVGNQAPVITPLGIITITEGDYFYYQIIATDGDGNEITFSDNTPIFDINRTTGIIAFTANIPGTFLITIVAYDICNATHDIFTLNVLPKNILNLTGGGGNGTGGGTPPKNETDKDKNNKGSSQSGMSGGVSPAVSPPAEKKNESSEKPAVEALTPEELARFRRAQIIYIGDFKDQNIFNVTMYEGPVWFFTYSNTNYFLTLTNISDESMFIGFFDGPGFLFRRPSEIFADINLDNIPEIRISYENRTGGNYKIVLEALKRPKKELPSYILRASGTIGILFLIIIIILSLYSFGKGISKRIIRQRDPLRILKEVKKENSYYKARVSVHNIGDSLLELVNIEDILPTGCELDGEVKVIKQCSSEITAENTESMLSFKTESLSPGEGFRVVYALKSKKKPMLISGDASYKIKLLDTYVEFSKKFK